MKTRLITAAVVALAAGLAGCSTTISALDGAAAVTTKIAANSPTACADLQGVGVIAGAAASQVAAANPNNAAMQKVAANISVGRAPANADCLLIANVAGLVSATVSGGAATASADSTK
jgi:hypothetical protein